jgi:hypothetical protein
MDFSIVCVQLQLLYCCQTFVTLRIGFSYRVIKGRVRRIITSRSGLQHKHKAGKGMHYHC